MSKFTQFFKQNKIKKENTTYPATKSLVDENGKPLEWVIQPLTTEKDQKIRNDCTYEEQVVGRKNEYKPKFDVQKYLCKMACASILEPNLYDKELQDSYGVMTPEDLLKSMVDNPKEYDALVNFIDEYNGNTSLQEKVEEVKN